MKRAVLAIVGTVASLVMLLSFKTHPQATATPPAAISSSSGTTSGSTSSTTRSSAAKTYTGAAVDTQYGPVQVQITVQAGKLVKVAAIEYPTHDPRDQQINSYAVPALNQEALAAGSAHIDMVSGATYTSQGYLSSLQSALDQAGL